MVVLGWRIDVIIKERIKRVVQGYRYSSELYVEHLKSIGVNVGEDLVVFAPTKTVIDEQYPWMITIGDHVRITEGVKILTHDYAWSVMKCKKGDYEGVILGASGKIVIGNNVFIGVNSVLTRGISIGDNVVIGAGSVVTKDCESNAVYAGNPVRRIMSIEEYYQKRRNKQIDEAKSLAIEYYKHYKKTPPKEIFHEYFFLFEDYQSVLENDVFKEKMMLGTGLDRSIEYLERNKPAYNSFDEFIQTVLSKEDDL